jgi:N utilization substance protein A
MRLFEQEVPEIYDNTVVIKGRAREAGSAPRSPSPAAIATSIAWRLRRHEGLRVTIIRERGEKIDIIEFSDDPVIRDMH